MRQLRTLALGLACLAGLASPVLALGHDKGPTILGCTHETAATSYSKPVLEQDASRIIRICEVFLDTTSLQYAPQGGRIRLATQQLAAAAHDVRLFIDYPDRVPGAVQRVGQSWQALSALVAPLAEGDFGPRVRPLRDIEGFLGEMKGEAAKGKS
jgi:hypothetical protein